MIISKEEYLLGLEAYRSAGLVESRITDHVNEIVRNILLVNAGHCHNWWDWEWHEDEGPAPGMSWPAPTDVYLPLYIDGSPRLDWDDEDGHQLTLAESIPIRWLFMSLAGVRKEFDDGRLRYHARRQEEEEKKALSYKMRQLTKSQKLKAKRELLNSLTAEQRAILGS
jgi:hypothetical protein